MPKLPLSYYQQHDVVKLARNLLGKKLVTNWNGILTSGRIVETEAYAGVTDRASHAFGGRRTKRNEVMYARGGFAYVYLCYGIHHLFNVVTNEKGIPHAVLIRGIEPVDGIDEMLKRTGKAGLDHTLTRGPGNLSKALGITTMYSYHQLNSRQLYLEDDGYVISKKSIISTPRIGVGYAMEDALLPYRFYVAGNPFVSGRPGK